MIAHAEWNRMPTGAYKGSNKVFYTDTYRNNMNDFVLIHLPEDEIYVRPLTVYILQFYQLKNPQSFIILF